MLKVLGRASSINVRKVLWACDEIGIAHEREDWGAGFRDTRSPEFLALNPNGLVPVIVDGDVVMWESNAIIRYLAASRGAEALLPAGPRARAGVEMWMDWQATDFSSTWLYAFHALVRRNPAFDDPAQVAASLARWAKAMALLDAQLARTGAHVAGAAFSLADICVGLSVNRWFLTPMDRPAFPAVQAYHDRLTARPGFARHGPGGGP